VIPTDLRQRLTTLPPAHRDLLDRCAALALARDAAPYLVGGAVRDLTLNRPTHDLDLVVVGDAQAVARDAHALLGGDLTLHDAFGTATLALPDGRAIDLITARREHYPAPGALPVVTPGTLDDDLRRRDFTLNALAVSLSPADYGTLIDPLGGQADLAAGIIRILHAASFQDDPTRLLRAIRYAERLTAGTDHLFTFDPMTAERFAAAISGHAISTVSIQRLAHEFVRLLAEPAAAAMLGRLATSALLPQIEPHLRWDDGSAAQVAALDRLWPLAERPDAHWQGRFALIAAHHDPAAAAATASALHLPSGAIELARETAEVRQVATSLPIDLTAAELGRLLDPFNPAALVVAVALLPAGPRQGDLRRYLTTIRPLKPALTGDAIRALGVPPGPIYRHALAALRDHKRNSPTLTTDDERAFLINWLRDHGALHT
jgi:tRNA nucleotidyltransferase (CCA-adding enzyme)